MIWYVNKSHLHGIDALQTRYKRYLKNYFNRRGCVWEKIKKVALDENVSLHFSNVHSSDIFYKENNNYKELYDKYGCVCVEMESFALFHNAKVLNKKASCLLTISDSLVTNEETTSEERQNSFGKMIKLALDAITLS